MRNRPQVFVAGSVLVMVALLLAVPTCFGQDAEIQDILDGLEGLPFDQFIDASYKQILLRSPELVTSMGLSQTLGIRDDELDNICNDFVIETYELEAGILEILETYDRAALSYEQQISFDSYSWILEGWAVEHDWMYHFYPVTHGFSRQNELFRFMEDEHPLETPENAEDYISRLEQIDDQLACLIQNLDDSEARGVMAPAQMLQRAADQIRGIVPGTAVSLSFYTSFRSRLVAITELSLAQRQALLDEASQAIIDSVIPAYQALVAPM